MSLLAPLIVLDVEAAQAQTTALYFDSEAGDYIGQGIERTWTAAEGVPRDAPTGRRGKRVLQCSRWSVNWDREFPAAGGVLPVVGSNGSDGFVPARVVRITAR